MSSGASTGCELLTTAEMAEADRLAVAAGVPFLTLMENAGRAVADEAMKMVPVGARIAVLCGPGNNGGDGFVAARLLRERGYRVRVACTAPAESLKGDAAEMARRWGGKVLSDAAFQWEDAGLGEGTPPIRLFHTPAFLSDAQLIVDAILGAGLNRPMDAALKPWIAAIGSVAFNGVKSIPILAIDVPSGLDGNKGDGPEGVQFRHIAGASRTVTFFRRKRGHVLLPGRDLCGEVVVADIGIGDAVLHEIVPATFANAPALWRTEFPKQHRGTHKYTRGHAVVVSGPPDSTGAARLGARGALRVGAGLVTVASPLLAFPVNAAHLTAIMLKPFEAPGGLAGILEDKRKNAVLIGPGAGVGAVTREMVAVILRSDAALVLDADALVSFVEKGALLDDGPSFGYLKTRTAAVEIGSEGLFDAIKAGGEKPVVLTPHEGEFKRLFGDLPGSKLDRARAAAKTGGAVVVLKGPDTVIASPDGRAAINENAPPWLATAGSGDVLAGFITGLLAQGMPAFQAACAAVWLHGECANVFGTGLIAEDLPEVLPRVLSKLLSSNSQDER